MNRTEFRQTDFTPPAPIAPSHATVLLIGGITFAALTLTALAFANVPAGEKRTAPEHLYYSSAE